MPKAGAATTVGSAVVALPYPPVGPRRRVPPGSSAPVAGAAVTRVVVVVVRIRVAFAPVVTPRACTAVTSSTGRPVDDRRFLDRRGRYRIERAGPSRGQSSRYEERFHIVSRQFRWRRARQRQGRVRSSKDVLAIMIGQMHDPFRNRERRVAQSRERVWTVTGLPATGIESRDLA